MANPLALGRSVVVLPLLVGLLLWAQPANAAGFDHTPLQAILEATVRAGRVDYAGLKAAHEPKLRAYLAAVAKAKPAGWSRDAQLAFYLNAYNAIVLGAVVERWPSISNVLEVKGFFDRLKYPVAGRTLTLNQLEKEIILKKFGDPRIHFALVCAARSCPPLRAAIFRANGLSGRLDQLTRAFINSRSGVQQRANGFHISTLFQWYAQDFAKAGGVAKFLGKYHKRHGAELAAATKFSYLPYNWSLNKR